jgi:hypothetical protein
MDPKCRVPFANEASAHVITKIMETKYSVSGIFLFFTLCITY